jgi:hypothetical protein
VRFAFAFAPHPTRTGWARDRRPRAPRFVFLFFTSPLPFRVLFLFVSFRFRFRFHFISFHFFFLSYFWRLSSTVLPLQAPPSFAPVHPHPWSRLFSPRLPCSLAMNGASFPTLIHSRSPSFALLAGNEEDRLWLGFLSVFSGSSFFFSVFSRSCFTHPVLH